MNQQYSYNITDPRDILYYYKKSHGRILKGAFWHKKVISNKHSGLELLGNWVQIMVKPCGQMLMMKRGLLMDLPAS